MTELEQSSTAALNSLNDGSESQFTNDNREAMVIPIDNDDEPAVFEAAPVMVTAADVALPQSENSEEELVQPEFDRIHAMTRFLVGGVLEGTEEFGRRLELWEAYLREELTAVPPDLSAASERDLLRYGLVGFIFESEETGRALFKKLLKVPGGLAKTAVGPTKSIANSRFTGPLRRRLDRMADRGESQLLRWIERGHAEEPLSRNLARLGIQEITDEIINQLAQNEEVKELVQEQSKGLASEAVGQVRERTFSADTLVERIARAVTRRTPRLEPPLADLSEFSQNPLLPSEKSPLNRDDSNE